jgi:hypothetical protein
MKFPKYASDLGEMITSAMKIKPNFKDCYVADICIFITYKG